MDTKIKAKNKPIYFTKLELENIRSFGGSQCLDLTDDKRRPAQWTLILGNNGVGKTTLLQCLARMRPRFNKEPDVSQDSQPDWLDSDLAREEEEENDVLKGLTRLGTDELAKFRAELITGATFDGSSKRGNRPKPSLINSRYF